MKQSDKLRQQIKELEHQHAAALAAEAFAETDTAELAILLHEMFCHRDHTEVCPWRYEIKGGVHDWGAFAHQKFLVKAKELVVELKFETPRQVIDFLKIVAETLK